MGYVDKATIYTEYKNVNAVKEILDRWFLGYTLNNGIGVYNGVEEQCLVVTIIDEKQESCFRDNVNLAAKQILLILNQQVVYCTFEVLNFMEVK